MRYPLKLTCLIVCILVKGSLPSNVVSSSIPSIGDFETLADFEDAVKSEIANANLQYDESLQKFRRAFYEFNKIQEEGANSISSAEDAIHVVKSTMEEYKECTMTLRVLDEGFLNVNKKSQLIFNKEKIIKNNWFLDPVKETRIAECLSIKLENLYPNQKQSCEIGGVLYDCFYQPEVAENVKSSENAESASYYSQ